MRTLVIAISVTVIQVIGGATNLRSLGRNSTIHTVPNTYIISLAEGTHLKQGSASPHAEFYHNLKTSGASWRVTMEYSSSIFTGAVVKLGGESDYGRLAEIQGVESIAPVHVYPKPNLVERYILNVSNQAVPKARFSPHALTGVDKLHRLGYYGKGIKIGIIDSGIDYTHPALGGKIGPGNKVIGGYDFVGNDFNGDPATAKPSDDPLDQCEGHGTHVAGIIGANPNNPYGISGVAYQASINAYRIFGCTSGTSDDYIIAGLLRAYKDGNDVFNLSVGGPGGWTTSMVNMVADRIANAGRIVVVSAGNEGEFGAWFSSDPSNGIGVISVGSVENTLAPAQRAIVSNGRIILYKDSQPINVPAGLPLYATSSDTNAPADACKPLPEGTPDLSGRLVVMRRGGCFTNTKLDNASNFGARYFLIYDNRDQSLTSVINEKRTVALISQADGRYLVTEGIPKGLTLSFPNRPSIIRDPNGGLMSLFSTYGPTYDMYMKPALSAPGGSILSTYPIPLGPYAVVSGTSMAAPYVAGAAALWLQVKGKTPENGLAARAAFQNTAKPTKWSPKSRSLLSTAAHQGAGLIQLYDAIKTTTRLLPAELLMNDTSRYRVVRRMFIKNEGTKPVLYKLTHEPAGTARTINGIENNLGPTPLVARYAKVLAFPRKLIVPAGWALPVKIWIRRPRGLNPRTFPVYSGYIRVKGSDGSSVRAPYLGLAASLRAMKVLDNTASVLGVKLPVVYDSVGQVVDRPTTFSLNGIDIPSVVFRQVAGSPLIQLDLIDSKSNVKPNQRDSPPEVGWSNMTYPVSQELWSRDSRCTPKECLCEGTFAQVKTIGLLERRTYVPRDVRAPGADPELLSSSIPVSQFFNGSRIPDGSYKFLLRARRIGSNGLCEGNYEVWTSPLINVNRNYGPPN